MLEDLPGDALWSAAGIGLFQLPMNVLGIVMGGNCRVGLEDNIFFGFDRRQLATNVELVQRLVEIARSFGRPVATHVEARTLLGLSPAPALGGAVPAGAGGQQG